MTAYYNDNDAYVAQWLRNLISADLIAQRIKENANQ